MTNDEQQQPIKRWEYSLYPELKQFAASDRSEALSRARHGSLDTIETIGLAIALILVVAITKSAVAGLGLAGRLESTLANFVIAIPLLLVLAGPFYIRRVRRGLRMQLKGGLRRSSVN
jgi:cation transport ATPase